MIKVLLADDNKYILELYSKIIDWEKYDFKIVSCAIDGQDAYYDFIKFKPEIVIMDIQMPGFTGIQLAEKMNKIAPETIIIFLSSYKEFSYAKSAVDLGVFKYILKHETEKSEFLDVLLEAKKEVISTKYKKIFLHEGTLQSILNDVKKGKTQEEYIENYKISFPDKYDVLLIIQDHIYPVISKLLSESAESIQIGDLHTKCYDVQQTLAITQVDTYQFLYLAKRNKKNNSYFIKQELENAFAKDFTVITVCENCPIDQCAVMSNQIIKMSKIKFFYPCSSVLPANLLSEGKVEIKVDTKKMGDLIKSNNMNEFCSYIDECYLSCIEYKNAQSFEILTEFCFTTLLSYDKQIYNFDTWETFHVIDDDSRIHWFDAKSIYQWIKNKFAIILKNNIRAEFSDDIKKAIYYINSNYMNSELGVETVANHLGISINNLNMKFKKETGKTTWQIIIKIRMVMAKKLLNMGVYTASEICEMTGYNSISYFSSAFKKTYGMSPQDYRRKKA